MTSWNKRIIGVIAGALPMLALAQAAVVPPSLATPPITAPPPESSGDPLIDALTCRSGTSELPNLLARLRRERPDDFVQTDRQYSNPAMDLYRLDDLVRAWGQDSDAIVITDNRVLMVVPGPVEAATQRLEESLAATASEPLSGALDDQHALVVYEEQRPGLQQRVLIGCEYRLPNLSLLDDPDDAWRKPASSAPSAGSVPAAAASGTR